MTEPWWDRLRIPVSDMIAESRPADASPLWLLMAREANVAAWVGLCTAVAEFAAAGPSRVWDRLAAVGHQTREALADLPAWSVEPPASPQPAWSVEPPASPQPAWSVAAPPDPEPTAPPSPGPSNPASAITGLRPLAGQDVSAVRGRLLAEHAIVTTAAAPTRAPRDMTGPLLRISPHVDCTPEDLSRLYHALQSLT